MSIEYCLLVSLTYRTCLSASLCLYIGCFPCEYILRLCILSLKMVYVSSLDCLVLFSYDVDLSFHNFCMMQRICFCPLLYCFWWVDCFLWGGFWPVSSGISFSCWILPIKMTFCRVSVDFFVVKLYWFCPNHRCNCTVWDRKGT